MHDVRAPDRILIELDQAQRRLEKDAPTPSPVRELLIELADTVADSGPLELGVSPRRWVRTQARVNESVSAMQRDDSVYRGVSPAEQALGQLRRLFKLVGWSQRWRGWVGDSRWAPFAVFAFCSLLLAAITWLVESLAHDDFSASWLLPALPVVTIFFFASLSSMWRSAEAATGRQLAARLAPNERCLLSCRMPNSQVVIATDQQILAGNLRNWRDYSRPLWSVLYLDITSFTSDEKTNDRRVTVHAGPRRA